MGRPVRTCVGCRRQGDKDELTRLVVVRQAVEVDLRQVAPGRGAYLHPDDDCLALAIRRRSLPRALRITTFDPEALRRRWAESSVARPPA